MAKLKEVGQDYFTGDFFVLRRTGNRLTGYGGSFYSEWFKVRGAISGGSLELSTRGPFDDSGWTSSSARWVPGEERIAGYRKVTKSQLRNYSGGGLPFADNVCP